MTTQAQKTDNGFGVALAAWRDENGWTQQDVADEAGMRQPNISAIESGATVPLVSTVAWICNAIGMTYTLP